MSAPEIPVRSRTLPKPQLLSLPTEILQSIYLHCFSPDLPHASPILTYALSTEFIYKVTFLRAFWNDVPLVFAQKQAPQPYEPGLHVQSLFLPSSVPVPQMDSNDEAQAQTISVQKTVLAYRWCNFHRAKLYFSSVIEAVTRDLFMTLNVSLSSHDQPRFDSFIAQTLPASRSTFEATALDGSHLTLEYPRRLATALLITYHGGSDPRLAHNTTPNVTIRPTDVLALPEHVLTGHPQWTEEKVDLLQMLCSYVNLRSIQYELSAFHEGMRNAIVQANHDALLVLLWQADRLAAYRPSHSHAHDESPFEPPGELFRLVARCGMRDSAVLDECSSSGNVVATSVSVKLFTLLLRVHAESMPRNDTDITRWAQQLLTCRDSSEPNPAGFARWVLDWGERESGSEFLYSRYAIAKGTMKRKVRRPLFRGGGVSRTRKDDEMVRRFVEICGGRVERFGEELERIGRARGGLEMS